MAKGRFYAGGGQGGDVLSQVDSFIEGRPAQGDGGSDSGKPTMLQGVLWAARDAILGKPKVDDIRPAKTTSSTIQEQEAVLDGVGDGTKPKQGNGVLDIALRVLGGMF